MDVFGNQQHRWELNDRHELYHSGKLELSGQKVDKGRNMGFAERESARVSGRPRKRRRLVTGEPGHGGSASKVVTVSSVRIKKCQFSLAASHQ